MKIAWIGLLIEILIFNLIKPFITDFEVAVIFLIGINILFVSISIGKNDERIRLIFYLAYIMRILAMMWSVYAQNIFKLPFSGQDSEGFLLSATRIADNPSLFKSNIYGGVYSKILGGLFYITAPERLLGQYINVLLGITILTIIYQILNLLDINETTKIFSISLISFLPESILLSEFLLRENFIVMFVVLSFYFFIKWYKHRQNKYIVFSMISILIASSFHSGVIGIIVGYVFMYMFYKHDINELRFNKKTVFIFILFLIVSYVIYVNYGDIFLSKFSKAEDIEDIYNIVNSRKGGAAYLTGLKMDTWYKIVLFAPIKMFYFLTAPLPIDWRGIEDIIAFIFDGIVYFYMIMYCFCNLANVKVRKPLLISISIILLVPIFIFGVAVSNAGTAMRHRHKFFSIIVVFYAIISDCERKMVMMKRKS